MHNTPYIVTVEQFKGWSQETTNTTYEATEGTYNFEAEAIRAIMYKMDVYRVSLTVDNLLCREIRFEDRMEARK